MIEVREASARILAKIGLLSQETVATGNAAGRVLAERVNAPMASPPWDNSSMDGYALRAADLRGTDRLRVADTIVAGTFPTHAIGAGEAMLVMTGAPVPEGADTVMRHEDTDNGT